MIASASVSPDYYDELTYREYIKKLISQNEAPVPPEKDKFITEALSLKGGLRFTGLDVREKGQQIEEEGVANIPELRSSILKIKALDSLKK
jgi:hypothetical protein